MKSWLIKAVFAGAALAALGPVAPALAQVLQQQATVLTSDRTTCQELFAHDPVPVFELSFGPGREEEVTEILTDGTLTVGFTLNVGTQTELTSVSWQSLPIVPEDESTTTPVRAVILDIVEFGTGLSKIYLYPKNALFDTDLTAPSLTREGERVVNRIRVCYGGTTPTLAKFATCPLTGDPSDPQSELGAACASSGALFFMYFDLFTSDAGPRNGEGPALCRCTETFFTCDPSRFREPGACFGTDEIGNPLAAGVVESVTGAEANNLVRYDFNPRCKTKCYDLDGVRVCERYCKK